MIPFAVCLACLQHKWTPGNSLGWTASVACSISCPGQSLSTSYWPSTSWSFTQSCLEFFASNGSFLAVRNLSLFEHLYAAISKLVHNHTLDLGEVKLFWRVLIHLTISALQISGSFSNFRDDWRVKNSSSHSSSTWAQHIFYTLLWGFM